MHRRGAGDRHRDLAAAAAIERANGIGQRRERSRAHVSGMREGDLSPARRPRANALRDLI
ncbi:hypothetical protein SPZE110945_07940 [Sphingomonas zeae]